MKVCYENIRSMGTEKPLSERLSSILRDLIVPRNTYIMTIMTKSKILSYNMSRLF